jgi:hypothetical protein
MKLGTCKLEEIARVGLGFKSLQNQFFYVSKETIRDFEIEKRYLRPIYQLADLESSKYRQTKKSVQWVFYCRDGEQDLRGTGALRYIRTVGKRPAAEKKQTGKHQTIQDALQAQGSTGGTWYMPKAQLHQMNIWLRKAFNSVYSPFIFDTAAAVDQRCNYVQPLGNIEWKPLAAILTSSLFALSAESFGSASMGAGVLDLPTTKIQDLRVVDVRDLKDKVAREELLSLAEDVWTKTTPCDWGDPKPTSQLRELDQWLISAMKTRVTVGRLYDDLARTLNERLVVAKEKHIQSKKGIQIDIRTVARGVADLARPVLESIRFPESLIDPGTPTSSVDFTVADRLEIECHPMMGQSTLLIRDSHQTVLLEGEYPRSVAQIIVKALFLGRRNFSFPIDEASAEITLKGFSRWFPKVLEKIQSGCAMSAVGSRFEEGVHNAVLEALHLDPSIQAPEFFGHIQIQR